MGRDGPPRVKVKFAAQGHPGCERFSTLVLFGNLSSSKIPKFKEVFLSPPRLDLLTGNKTNQKQTEELCLGCTCHGTNDQDIADVQGTACMCVCVFKLMTSGHND